MDARQGGLGAQLVRAGFALARLDRVGADALACLAAEAAVFFRRDAAFKASYASENFLHGFRSMGRQYSGQVDTIDLNESLVLRAGSFAGWPRQDGIDQLRDALGAFWRVGMELTASVLEQIRLEVCGSSTPEVAAQSYIEVNWYHHDPDREFLQERHEDGHLLTVAHSSRAGLEIEAPGGWQSVRFDAGTVALMAGSLLMLATGGRVPAMYHRVRQVPFTERISILLLVDPVVDERLEGFAGDVAFDGDAVAEHIRTIGHQFGLPDAPVADRRR